MLAAGLEGRAIVAVFDLHDALDLTNASSFSLWGLTGTCVADGSCADSPMSWGADCLPVNHFDASIKAGHLTASADAITVGIGTLSNILMRVSSVQLAADVTVPSGSLANGLLSGIVLRADVEDAVGRYTAACSASPAPTDTCQFYLSFGESILPMLYDLDLDGDAKKDAISVCLLFESEPVALADVEP